jgi:hypothetical protein
MATKPKKERLTAERLMAAAREIEQQPQGYFTTAQLAESLNADYSLTAAALQLMDDKFEQLRQGRWRVRTVSEEGQ